jgi:hypothetical protein
VEQDELERIARATLKDLGVPRADLIVSRVENQPGHWRLDIRGTDTGARTLKIKCSPGTTAQWVREQIFNQYTSS